MARFKDLFLRKDLHAPSSEVEEGEEPHQLKRHLRAHHLTSIGIGAIIGAGIFVITGQAAAFYAGPAILLSFFIAAVICLFAALCYAEFSSIVPISGGSYSYAYVSMGEFPAWLVGWATIVQYLASACTVAVGWSGYFVGMLRDFGISLPESMIGSPLVYHAATGWSLSGSVLNVPAIILVAIITAFIAIGIKAAANFNNVMVVIKLVTIALFIVIGISFIHPGNWKPFIPPNTGAFGEFGWSGVLRAAGLVFFAYNGFDTVATLAQETVNPQRDISRGILGALGISTVAYLLTVTVLTGVVSYTLLGVADPMSVALNAMGPSYFWFSFIVKLAIIAGLASVVLAQVLGQTRIFFAMSRDGLLPKLFSRIHPTTHTPFVSTLIIGLISIVISGLFPVDILGQLVSFAVLFVFGIVCLGVLILRYTHPEYHRPFKVPFSPYIPLAGLLGCFGQMCFLSLTVWLQFLAWLAVGLVIYRAYSYRNSKIRKR